MMRPRFLVRPVTIGVPRVAVSLDEVEININGAAGLCNIILG